MSDGHFWLTQIASSVSSLCRGCCREIEDAGDLSNSGQYDTVLARVFSGGSPMNKISVQNLNGIFDVIEDLSSTVGWIRDITGKKQLYVSRNYEKIWEHPVEELYEHPSSFNEWLITDGNPSRKKNSAGLNLYRVRKAHDKVIFIKDQHYLLTNEQGTPVGHVGFATEVSEGEWEKSFATLEATHVDNGVQKNVLAAVQQELKIYSSIAEGEDKSSKIYKLIEQYISTHALNVTPREKACLVYLFQGNVLKKIATLMGISIRTVETHLENIKLKFGCRNTLQLISKISALS